MMSVTIKIVARRVTENQGLSSTSNSGKEMFPINRKKDRAHMGGDLPADG